ncbi:MAG: hypothetical protein M1823_004920 [Watsoniomyces obsoletus]|nr:MAG: hypothetical protein M1823_004920 [Watsoniomyces obsoletus]
MSSQSPAPHVSAKGINPSGSSTALSVTTSPAQSSSSFAADSHGQRRPGGSGSSGSGAASRQHLASPRNHQVGRKRHKDQKRPRLVDEDALAESAVMKSTSSRKGQTSITHLMSFALPPRPQSHSAPHLRHARRNPTWGLGSGYHAVDKARYVHANYRFIVDPRGDYHVQAMDADVHLDWDAVLQILASSQTQCTACPICLSTPVAPRMAKCGHIFCLPCLIRYMHAVDDTKPTLEKRPRWKKCPICWDSIYTSETRPVRWFVGQEGPAPRDGDDVVLRLLMRRPGGTLALPRDEAEGYAESDAIPWYSDAEVMDYARVMKGTERYMTEQYDEEIAQMQEREKEDELLYGDEPEWTKKAVSAVREAQQRIQGIGNAPTAPAHPVVEKQARRPNPKSAGPGEEPPEMYLIRHAAASKQSSSSSTWTTPSRELSKAPSISEEPPSDVNGARPNDHAAMNGETSDGAPGRSTLVANGNPGLSTAGARRPSSVHHPPQDFAYYFYQALPHYYLSPLDIRILKAAFGDFASFPATLLPRVDHVSTGHVVDDELRKRARYLAHLPFGCEVAFLECDWTDVVGPEILERFGSEVERRRKKNRDKEVREEKDRVRAEKQEESQRWAAARRRRSNVSRESILSDGMQSELAMARGGDVSAGVDFGGLATTPPWSISNRGQHGSGFAALASPSTSPVTHRTVWGTPLVPPSSPPTTAAAVTAPEPEDHDDGWLQGWEQELLREVDVVAQSQQLDILGSSKTTTTTIAPSPAAGGKKKKGKKITLMSTNVRRGA